MTRLLGVLTVVLLTCAALAVPAPDPFASGWGSPIDSNRDCRMRRGSGTLTIEMPGTDHDYDPHREQFNAPRILREVEGDFVIQVRVQFEECHLLRGMLALRPTSGGTTARRTVEPDRDNFRPSALSTIRGQPSHVSAGFLIIPPDTYAINCIRLEYGVAGHGTGTDGYTVTIHRDVKGGRADSSRDKRRPKWPFKSKPNHVYQRLERQGEILGYDISSDGKSWVPMGGGAFRHLPPKLTVGLGAYTTSTEPSKVCFDQFRIMRGKKKDQ